MGKGIRVFKYIIAILICQGVGAIGSFFTTPVINTWYVMIKKPSFNPPNWIFGPVWLTLFLLMGLSYGIIWNKDLRNKKVRMALFIFIVQLILNILWSFFFFGMQSLLFGFIVIIILWIAILLTIIKFHKFSKKAAYLLLPYILWVSFAVVLNFSILILNLK